MSTIQPKAKPRNSTRRRRWSMLVGFILLALIAFILFTYFGLRFRGINHLKEAFAEADRLDPGWRLEDLEARRLPFPEPDKNGYFKVQRVKAAMPTGIWPVWPFPQFDGEDSYYVWTVRSAIDTSLSGDRMAPCLLNAEELRVLRAELARAAEALEFARRMPEYPYGRAPVQWTKDYSSTPMTGMQEVRVVADLLRCDARLRAHNNDLEGALHDIKAILFASRSLGDDPRLVAILIRMASDSIACGALEKCLACGRVSEKTLADLQRELEREAERPLYLLGARGERAGCELQLDNVQQGEIPLKEFYRMDGDLGGSYLSSASMLALDGNPPSATQKNLEFVRKFVNIQDERAKMLRFMNEQVEFGKLPAGEMIRATEEKAKSLESVNSSKKSLSQILSQSAQLDARTRASLRVAYTALASERFHLAHGKWPERVQDLVPQYLSAVPLDPYDSAPLRIVRKGSAIVVYSVSQDREDQGGTLLDVPTNPGSDIGFVLQVPSQRRRPAKPFEFPARPVPEPPDPDDGDK
jgi:hypothetical protein